MFHISDIKKYNKCPHLYYKDLDAEDESYVPFLRIDESFSDLLKKYCDIDRCFDGQVGDDNERLLISLNEYDWFLGARVNDGQIRARIPLMHKTSKGMEICFTVFNTSFRDPDYLTYRIVLDLLNKLNITVSSIWVVYINGSYVYRNELDVKQLLIMSDEFRGEKLLDLVKEKESTYETVLKEIEGRNALNSPAKRNRFCKGHGVCRHYSECFPDDEELPDDSILTLVSSGEKSDLYEKGILTLKDASEQIELSNRVQYAQVRADMNGGLFVDHLALNSFLKKLKVRPLVFLDFEWDTYLVPKYEGLRPLNVVCFEYALYVMGDDGSLYHKCFIGEGDCRKDFVASLLNDIPDDARLVAYNAKGAEVLRIRELAEQLPEYHDALLDLSERFVDLAIPFTEGIVYHVAMRGNFTLKRLVDMVSDFSYKDLSINDGMKAVVSWRDIDKGVSDDKDAALRQLEEYCSLDAYGLYLVYKWLIKITDENA